MMALGALRQQDADRSPWAMPLRRQGHWPKRLDCAADAFERQFDRTGCRLDDQCCLGRGDRRIAGRLRNVEAARDLPSNPTANLL